MWKNVNFISSFDMCRIHSTNALLICLTYLNFFSWQINTDDRCFFSSLFFSTLVHLLIERESLWIKMEQKFRVSPWFPNILSQNWLLRFIQSYALMLLLQYEREKNCDKLSLSLIIKSDKCTKWMNRLYVDRNFVPFSFATLHLFTKISSDICFSVFFFFVFFFSFVLYSSTVFPKYWPKKHILVCIIDWNDCNSFDKCANKMNIRCSFFRCYSKKSLYCENWLKSW